MVIIFMTHTYNKITAFSEFTNKTEDNSVYIQIWIILALFEW
jgi:hypothetical protein